MNIVTLHNYYQRPGGEDMVFAAETALLRHQGHRVMEYIEHNKRLNGMSRINAAIQTIWSRPSRKRLLQTLYEVQPDLVHFHNTFLLISPSAYYACRKAGVPVVQTLHNYRILCPAATNLRAGFVCEDCEGKILPWPGVLHACYRNSRVQTAVTAAMLTFHRWLKTWKKQVNIYIALTEFARKRFVQGGIPDEKIIVKPNFVNPDPGVKQERGEYVLFVGRLAQEKGVQTLLKAWCGLKGIPLKIVGDGPLMPEVRKLQREKLKHIEVLGHCSHEKVLELIKGSRFLVFPSEWHECFPVTLAEAFACGVPVVASRLGAMAEIVEDGRTGIHFTPGNPDDLADKVAWLWSHHAEARKMGQEARAEYKAKYTAERNYQMLMQIYETAIYNFKSRYS